MVHLKIDTELYIKNVQALPKTGQQIIGYQEQDSIVVYQAYKATIADFAVENQFLGGPDFSYSRMSWIKPNFLWMMFRCGWAEKENQERILALWVDKSDFEQILEEAVISSYNGKYYNSLEQWKTDMATKDVRLQWDPDHDPFGKKIERRAIQLGLKGKTLENFGKRQIRKIEDITGFVKQEKQKLNSGNADELLIPAETIFKLKNQELADKIGIDMLP